MAAAALGIGGTLPLAAQPGAIVQPLPSAAAVERLNQNLGRLSRSPQDIQALLGAGEAALDLGDVQAANGFFTRANMVAPNNGQAKLGLAVVSIQLKQAREAATYFDEAAALGAGAQNHLNERGLAYDLTGQQAKAQQDYQTVLRTNPSDSLARLRYAVSLGISGRVAEAEAELQPSLSAQDREAWRARAFILAMNGRLADARKITQTVMPKGLADALDPYIARASLLDAGQKAAAFHYGEFPSDVLRMAAATPSTPRTEPRAVTAEARPRKLSRRERQREEREKQAAEAAAARARLAAASEPQPPPFVEGSPQRSSSSGSTTLASSQAPSAAIFSGGTSGAKPVATGAPSSIQQPTPPASRPASPRPAPALSETRPQPKPAPQVPSDPVATRPAVATPVASAPTPVALPSSRSLAQVMANMDIPESERSTGSAPVDLAAVARIQTERRKAQEAVAAKAAAEKAKREAAAKAKAEAAAKAKAAAEEKARLAANPARTWVQIATGRDVDALAFDLRRLRRTYADVLSNETGWTAEWGATRRLLVGPFSTLAKAKDAVAAIKKSGGDAFIWSSEAGEDVVKIGGK
ncbi:SPOR domain-containing protein [Sphingobium sp. CR28]|uniref:SPOR domain-containing protein n=1 Tax=Sphingobium sp. CR28 TaxID=3400272 RepID=UPI003FF0C24D